MAARKKAKSRSKSRRRTSSARRRKSAGGGARKWSARVTRESDALDLDKGVFTLNSPKKFAA